MKEWGMNPVFIPTAQNLTGTYWELVANVLKRDGAKLQPSTVFCNVVLTYCGHIIHLVET